MVFLGVPCCHDMLTLLLFFFQRLSRWRMLTISRIQSRVADAVWVFICSTRQGVRITEQNQTLLSIYNTMVLKKFSLPTIVRAMNNDAETWRLGLNQIFATPCCRCGGDKMLYFYAWRMTKVLENSFTAKVNMMVTHGGFTCWPISYHISSYCGF